jgi:hypothetical protein
MCPCLRDVKVSFTRRCKLPGLGVLYLVVVSEIHLGPHHGQVQFVMNPALSQPCVEHGSLIPTEEQGNVLNLQNDMSQHALKFPQVQYLLIIALHIWIRIHE